jgi:hypothetical protein
MSAATGLAKGEEVSVEGYRGPGDGGEGVFRYEPESKATPDGGAVVELQKAPGRMVRVVGSDQDTHAEWFGAYGDGDKPNPHDDQGAISRCLAAYGRVKLLGKTYGVRGKPEPCNQNVSYHAVDLGPYYHMEGQAGKPVQCPSHEDVLIAGNDIALGTHMHAPWGTFGVSLFGGDIGAGVRMVGVHVRENSISGRAYTNAAGQRVCPIGLKVQILGANYQDIRFEDNTIDLPDDCDAPHIPKEPFAESILFFPLAFGEEATTSGLFLCRGNRNKESKVLYPILAD